MAYDRPERRGTNRLHEQTTIHVCALQRQQATRDTPAALVRMRHRTPENRANLSVVIRSARPAPALRHLIRYYYQVNVDLVARTVVQPVPARSPQAIEFTFGTPYTVHRLDCGLVEQAHAIA